MNRRFIGETIQNKRYIYITNTGEAINLRKNIIMNCVLTVEDGCRHNGEKRLAYMRTVIILKLEAMCREERTFKNIQIS